MVRLHPALQEMADQELADVNEMVSEYPTYSTFIQTTYGCRETGHLIAVDLLARLSEVADKPAGKQLQILTARIHAWMELTR